MSMSSLSAQLASLQKSGSKNAGSSLPSSKRHSDAVGRGLHYSAQHGHSISGTSAKHKPSVLYADSKSASDVPLTTLRENCVSSLRQLGKLTGNVDFTASRFLQTLAGIHSLQFERGLATASENFKMDTIIEDLLALLSTAMCESSNSGASTSCFSSSLHVIEYLLRRYNVHSRETTSQLLLQCVLPLHEEPIFGRVLQLVDLAALPTFSFLRPFAQPGAPPPTRTVFAKRASRDDALMKVYCIMVRRAAEIHVQECSENEEFGAPPRRGVSRVISYCAAVMIQALQIQTTNTKYQGSISEATLRTILPFVLSACGDGNNQEEYSLGNKCADWRGFGHVLASCIAEVCVLSTEARETLATAIIKGALENQKVFGHNDDGVELVADCLATCMSVLHVSPKQQEGKECNSKLDLVATGKQLGFVLPVATYKAMIKLDETLGEAIGHLYSDRDLVVAPLVASLVVLATSRLSIDKNKSVEVICNLIQQEQLKPLWMDRDLNLTASVAAAVLEKVASLSQEACTPVIVEGVQTIIQTLQQVHSTGCDAGIAHAVTSICTSNNKQVDVRPRLLEILNLSQDVIMNKDDDDDDMDVDDSTTPLLLPPRVALEHADASARLNAIERLSKEASTLESGGESLEQALLRHVLTEDELDVAVAAGEALVNLLGKASFTVTVEFANDCLKALEKWTLNDRTAVGEKSKKKTDKKKTKENEADEKSTSTVPEERVRALEVALEIAGYACHALNATGDQDGVALVQKRLLQAIVAHFDIMETKAGCALSIALGRSKKATKNASSLLLTSEVLLDDLRSCWNGPESVLQLSESPLSRRYLGVYSKVLTDALDKPRKSKGDKSLHATMSDALNTCVLKVQAEGEMGKQEIASLVEQFHTCAEHAKALDASLLLDVITKLSLVSSENTYTSVCVPAIQFLCDEFSAVHEVPKLRILMEAALRPEVADVSVLRLLSLFSSAISDDEETSSKKLEEVTVFILALLGHSEQSVRKAALRLIEKAGDAAKALSEADANQAGLLYAIFTVAADEESNTFSKIILGGYSALAVVLNTLVTTSKDPQNLSNEILKLCYRTACSMRANSSEDEKWLSLEEGEGGRRAATLVLDALELSGEATSPLLQRYNLAGRDVIAALHDEDINKVTKSMLDLVHSVARMMKGVIVVDSASVGSGSDMIISTGPSRRGTRARSYSVGRSPGVSFIEPYPKVMRDDLLNCLSYREGDSEANTLRKEMCRAVVHDVLGSPSWGDGVFKTMDKGSRKKLLESLLYLWKAESIDGSGDVFLALELDGKDVANLIRGEGRKKPDLSSVIFLCDYVHSHAERLRTSPGYADLVSLLFQTLEDVSSNDYVDEEKDEAEFARQSLLRVLGGLIPCEEAKVQSKQRKKFPKKDLLKWSSLLVILVGGTSKAKKSQQLQALPLGRPKTLAFSLLTSLCSDDPTPLVPMLVPAMLDSIQVDPASTPAPRSSNLDYRVSHDIFVFVVPVFFKYADAAGLSQFDLYNQVLTKAAEIEDDKRRMELYRCMVDAIVAMPSSGESENTSLIGCLIAAIVAFCVRSDAPAVTTEMSSATELATEALQMCSPSIQVSSLTQLIGYVYHLILKVSSTEQAAEQRTVSTENNIEELETAVLFASETANPQACRMSTVVTILSIVANSLARTPVMNLIMRGDERSSELSLNLWQDLLMLQSVIAQVGRDQGDNENASERQFWDECQRGIDSSLEQLQSLLPAHLFLASAALLIEDDSDTELCSRAVRLISERAVETYSDSPEASLFLDMLPMLARLLVSRPDTVTDETMFVHQSVFVAVEIFARSLCLKSSKDHRGRMNSFTEVLKHASALIKVHSAPFEKEDQVVALLVTPSCQVLCSAALCASTLVRLLTVRCIPLLPDLLGSLLSVLCSVNQAFSDQWNTTTKGHAAVLQLSILRALLAVADTLPQFLSPYLGRLLAPSALLSSSLRMEDTDQQVAVGSIASQLGVTLSQKIPARQLVPSLCKSLPKCKGHSEMQALLEMLKESVQQAPRSEVPALRSWLLKALTLAYEFCGADSDGESINLVEEANDVLLALVMKLSEAQLRPLFAKLREWRGDLDSEMTDSNFSMKRYAFWSLSALLSEQLRSIFLPCLSTVVSDAVDELELAAAQLCGSSKKKIDGGRKRQRLDSSDSVDDDPESWTFLKPLLSCLESALHADASEGGKWVRHDDSQRYHSLLSPLSKLLELRASSGMGGRGATESAFYQLVHGVEGEPGSVIGCLTAIAAAAGNEQLWKPLNHGVLQACGNESRAEVRKGGVSCLLSLIKALGEEYMVLLPECLPVLSELLEETDEEIAGLAQECVTIGEDLLGESLQESLR